MINVKVKHRIYIKSHKRNPTDNTIPIIECKSNSEMKRNANNISLSVYLTKVG